MTSDVFPRQQLGSLVEVTSGRLNSAAATVDGAYPFFTCSKEVLKIGHYEHDREAVLLGGNNANAIFPVFYVNGRFTARQRVYVIWSTDADVLDNRFLYYFLVNAAPSLVSAARGTTTLFITLRMLKELPIFIPPISIQRSVAALLSEIDERISVLRESNATLESIAQSLFKSWFVDFDPVRAKLYGRLPEGMDVATAALFPDEFEDSALGAVPKGWLAGTLGNQVARHGGAIQTGPFGSQLHASDYCVDGIPVVMPKDIEGRRINTATVARVDESHVTRLARHQLAAGDIVFSRRGDVERHALISRREAGWLCGTGCLLVRPGNAWRWPGYLSMLLDSPQARLWLVQHAVGATMPNLNTGILSSVPLVVPPAAILDQFEPIAMSLDTRRSESLATIETLAALRDTLLPRLIAGQLRLPSDINDLEETLA